MKVDNSFTDYINKIGFNFIIYIKTNDNLIFFNKDTKKIKLIKKKWICNKLNFDYSDKDKALISVINSEYLN